MSVATGKSFRPAVTALANWFGSNRLLAPEVGRQLGKLEWCGVPFVGGCCELGYIDTRTGLAADLHRDLINLARVVRIPTLKDELCRNLDMAIFHPDELAAAQKRCRDRSANSVSTLFGDPETMPVEAARQYGSVAWAYDYFICSWMGRGGQSGVDKEFDQTISFRWTASGGDSCKRFRSAAESLDAWCETFKPWNFIVKDAFSFLDEVKDLKGYGIYLDPPWPDDGAIYKHKFTEQMQRDLAKDLCRFNDTRVVVRYGNHPLIRELYPETHWHWITQTSKAQSNNDVHEVLILNGAPRSGVIA